jgi:hypothetical protein
VARAHRVAVLEGGQKWIANSQNAKDMDFVNLRNVSRDVMREAFRMHKVMLGVSDDVNRANAQTGEEVFSSWGIVPRLDRWRDVLNHFFLPMFGSTGEGVEFDYVTPVPANREQDNQELIAKSQAALFLSQAGFDLGVIPEIVGLPDMPAAPEKPAPIPLPPAPQTPPDQSGIPGESSDADGGAQAAALLRQLAPYNRGRTVIR